MKEVWFLNRCISSFSVSSTSIISRGWDSDSISCLKHMKSPLVFHLMESFPFLPLLSLHKTHKTRTYLCLHCHIDKRLKIFCEMTWQSQNMVGIQTKITKEIHPTVTQCPPPVLSLACCAYYPLSYGTAPTQPGRLTSETLPSQLPV